MTDAADKETEPFYKTPAATLIALEDPRVRFAAERTLLAWIRTGVALMGFGFVVARFGLFLREIAALGHVDVTVTSTSYSLWIGMALIGLGVAVSCLASWEYFRFILHSRSGRVYTPRTILIAVLLSVILAVLGVAMAAYLWELRSS